MADDRFAQMDQWVAAQMAKAERHRARMVEHWKATPPETHFNVYDIGAWADLAERAGVLFVPLEKLATWQVIDVLTADDAPEVPQPALDRLATPNSVARWSHCTGAFAKLRMGCGGGGEWDADMAAAWFADDRVYELLLDYPGAEVALYRREWVQGRMVDDFPVEYRAFVQNDRLIGISNYYLQRPLPNNAETLAHINVLSACTRKLIDAQIKPMNVGPHVPEWMDLGRNSWTVDFLVTADDILTIIDGGPPWGMNADPCCFPLGNEPPSGIALEDRSGRSARSRETPDAG